MTRELHLDRRPRDGRVDRGDFALVERELPPPGDGEVLVRNVVMSLDAAMLLRLRGDIGYAAPFELGRAVWGRAVGVVIESRSPGLAPGDHVVSDLGWREHFVAPGTQVERIHPLDAPPGAYLGVLGISGLAAYVGIVEVARAGPGETVYVSAAAGAAGGVAAQLAKGRGCRVVGSAGGPEKVAFLTGELGLDAAFDHRAAPPAQALGDLCPEGIDVYFDNVGGATLEAAIDHMRPQGRIALCGMVSQYGKDAPEGPRNLFRLIERRVTMRGFLAFDHLDRLPEHRRQAAEALAAGRLVAPETVFDGLDQAPAALQALLEGRTTGKVLVRL